MKAIFPELWEIFAKGEKTWYNFHRTKMHAKSLYMVFDVNKKMCYFMYKKWCFAYNDTDHTPVSYGPGVFY